jgi:hypothetical protein
MAVQTHTQGGKIMGKTKKEMLAEIRASKNAYITYGDGDLGIPVSRMAAIRDIESMDDAQIGEGTWYECDETGKVGK